MEGRLRMYGYMGKYLVVNLSEKKTEQRPLKEETIRKYIGGMGVNLKLMQEYYCPRTDEYSPDNPIIIGTGPLTDTLAPGASKIFATTKYPLNHCISTGVGGMHFSRLLKRTGFDHVVITGKSDTPVYLYITDQNVDVKDADDLWGLDIYQTTRLLKDRLGSRVSVTAIGPAGENLVKPSMALIDNTASLGKGGLAAVMGSKNIKAIAVYGRKKTRIFDPDGFKQVVRPIIRAMKASPVREKMMTLGSMAGWEHWSETAGIPYRDWTEIYPRKPLRERFGPEIFMKEVKKQKIFCPTCYLPCKERYEFLNEDGETAFTYASSFIGRVTAFGARCDVGDIGKLLICHDLCSRLGLDTYSVSASIDYAIKLFEDGIITRADTGGLELKRGFETTKALIRQIAFREGVGAVLADGFEHLGDVLGKPFESHIKGMDFIFDPRGYRMGTYELEQVVNPRGGHQHAGGSPTYGSRDLPLADFKKFCRAMSVSDPEMNRIFFSENDFNVARLTKHCEDYYTVYNCLGVCSRKIIKAFYTMDIFSQLYSKTTGIECTGRDLKQTGERVWNLLKWLNAGEGFDRERDAFPDIWFKPLHDGDKTLMIKDYYGRKQLTPDDVQDLLNDYYDERGWSISHGTPTIETLKKLGLDTEKQ